MSDKRKFGYEYNKEIQALEKQVAIDLGKPTNVFNQEVFFEARKRYDKIHATDPSYREKSEQRIANYEPQFPDHTRETIDLTQDEIKYMLDKLFGVNDEVGINLKNKLLRKI